MQNILVSIMLAQRIVVVLSPAFLEESWSEYEESIAHVTSLSQRRQRVVPVMLRDCDVPDALKVWKPLDAATEGFWDELFRALHVGECQRKWSYDSRGFICRNVDRNEGGRRDDMIWIWILGRAVQVSEWVSVRGNG